jgi:two-component SAPR family response regulator
MAKSVKVLIVEDDPTLREVMQDVLTGRGLEVVAASGGEEALERARHEMFDLIVADIRMEGISGLDTIEQAREIQPNVGSIVVSGYASEEETLRAVRLNVAGYLKKPFKITKLLELINKFLAKRSLRLKREQELTALKDVIFWSIEQQGRWAEKVHPNEIERPAELARSLARQQSMDSESRKQVYLGTLLQAMTRIGGSPPPSSINHALGSLPLFLDSSHGEGLSNFALSVCEESKQQNGWPRLQDLPTELDREALKLYMDFLENPKTLNPDEQLDQEHDSNLLERAAALESLGDVEGAQKAYAQILQEGRISQNTIQAHLRKARLAIRGGRTAELEQDVKEVLQVASKLGPVTLALTQFEASLLLKKAKHPAAAKLLPRAIESLKSLGYPVSWSCATVILQNLTDEPRPDLHQALSILSSPAHLYEVVEQLPTVLPDLLKLASRQDMKAALEPCRQLIASYPTELVSLVRKDLLDPESKHLALDILESNKTAVPRELILLFQKDSNPDIQEKARKLEGRGEASQAMPLLKLYTFGGVSAGLGDTQLVDKDWKTQKAKYLFVRLVAASPKPVSVDRLMEEFWPDGGDRARNNLNTSVSLIRRCLKKAGLTAIDPIDRMGDSLAIHPKLPLWYDAEEFTKASEQAQVDLESDKSEAALVAFGRMIRLYRGPYLDGCYLDWALEESSRLENLVGRALESLMSQRFAQHRYREALEYGLELLRNQPLHNDAHEVVMRSFMGLTQHEKAVKHFEDLQKELSNEYGTEPNTELMKTYHMARYGFQESTGLMDL